MQAVCHRRVLRVRSLLPLRRHPHPRRPRQQALVGRRHPVRARRPLPRYRRTLGLRHHVPARLPLSVVLRVGERLETRVEGVHPPNQRGLRGRGLAHGVGRGAVRAAHVDHLRQLRPSPLVQPVQGQPLAVHRRLHLRGPALGHQRYLLRRRSGAVHHARHVKAFLVEEVALLEPLVETCRECQPHEPSRRAHHRELHPPSPQQPQVRRASQRRVVRLHQRAGGAWPRPSPRHVPRPSWPPPPPSFKAGVAPLSVPQEEMFTLYVKDLGPWTKALRRAAGNIDDPGALLVDVDGFYSQVASFNTMMKRGASRVLIVAGGSGVTAVMGFIQDWCVAAAAGSVVPEVHLAWCCRTMVEMKLVGESIPSMLASAGSKKDSHFTLSLYCTSKTDTGPLSVSWPVNCNAYGGVSMEQVMGKNPIAASLNHSARILLAGTSAGLPPICGAAYGAYVLGAFDVARRGERGYHSGGTRLVLMIVCIVSALIVYDWLAYLVPTFPRKDSGVSSAQTHPSSASKAVVHDESKQDALESSATTATYDVLRRRVPTRALLVQEAELAKKKGHRSVKVLTSGPSALVDGVLADARAVDWQLFDTEELSYEF
ncbi:unnamed protein product [Ectocarpus sp. 12 AP-2014]